MPPRFANAQEQSASPTPENDLQDILVIQDIMDTLDQIPPELTRVHSDLNELGAVLYATLVNLETKLHQLIEWIQDPSIDPARRFQLLQEIAEEAARYKLGGDDKIRVAGGACDGIMAHQRHISNLLASSTLLRQDPPSPYTQSLILAQAPVYTSSRRQVARAVNSPFGGPSRAGGGGGTGDTPTKKKKNRVQAVGADDDASSVAGEKKKAPAKKRKPANRATSPADSLASTSAFANSRPSAPQTARQLAAAANKAKKAERADDSDDESDDDEKDGALGLDIGSREGSHIPGKGGNESVSGAAANAAADKSRRTGATARGVKRARADGEDEAESEAGDELQPANKRNGFARKIQLELAGDEVDVLPSDPVDLEPEERAYCICGQVSFGEMIGCDDDDCEIEWVSGGFVSTLWRLADVQYHILCLGLDKPPEGNWICPQCKERRKKNPKKKAAKAKAKK
ncbi:putative histone acetylation-related protein [Papiliotrema laurentii]|uniref:Inhibitor of growth protein 3 n=1 Tax=Papiliotrema laurentii TaxID=5418 RepID=A0AAD9FU52_PAPLA|nr:putative histone acetylation-related protein [Papiliotrema laurentii]